MPSYRTVAQKKADWSSVYEMVRETLTTRQYQEMLDAMMAVQDPNNPTAPLRAALDTARLVAANNRTAAIVAALLTGSGIAPSRALSVVEDIGDE